MTTTGIYTYDRNFSGDLGLVFSKPTDSIGYFNNATPRTSTTGTGLVYGAIAVSSAGDKMITCLYGGNVLTSTDAGVTWTFRTAPGANAWRTAAISGDGSVMVVGGEYTNVWTSTNSGVTWTNQTSLPNNRYWLASIISPDGQTIAVGCGGNPFIYVSTNSGITWTNRPNTSNGDDVRGIAIVYNAPSTILVTTNGGYIWKSVNSGESWTFIVDITSWGNIVTTSDGTTIAVAGPSNIQVSTDLGVSWSIKLSTQSSWNDVKVSSNGQKMVALSGSGHIHISTNAGTNWTQAQAYGPVKPITVTNSGSGAYLIDGVSNATMSFIRGNTYTLSINASGHPFWIQTGAGAYISGNIYSSGITLTSGTREIGTITFVVPSDAPDTLYYVCQNHSSMQGSITITNSTGPGPGGPYSWYNAGVSSDLSTIVCLVWTSTGGNNIYSLWKTTNLGTTWTRFEVTLGGGYIQNMDASSDLKYVIMAVNGDYVYTSTNSGTTYTRQTQSIMSIRAWFGVSTSQDGQILVAIAFGDGAYVSTNSGNTWSKNVELTNLYLCTSSSTGQILYIIQNTGRPFRSTDFGTTWTELTNSPGTYWQSLSTSANGMVLLGGNRREEAATGNIFFSIDMGNTWTTITADIVNPGDRVRNTYMSSSGQYMIIGSSTGIYISTNTGSTWRSLSNMSGARPVISDDGQVIIAASSSTIQISIDGGNTVSKTLTTSIQQTFLTYENDEGGMNISQDGRNFIVVSRFNGSTLPGFIWRNNQYVIPRDIGTSFQAYTSGTQLTSEIKTIFNQPFGVDWIPRGEDLSLRWFGVATSSNGKKMVACLHFINNRLYTSTNSGATWIINTNLQTGDYTSVSSSADGSILLTGSYNAFLYVSTNSGVIWTERTANGARTWWKTGVSSNGTVMVGCPTSSRDGNLYVSTDTGVTWTARLMDAVRNWRVAPAFSLDGTKILVADQTENVWGYLWISTDSGTTWTSRLTDSTRVWSGVASSSDGTKLAACVTGGQIWTSINSGTTWTTRGPSESWTGIVSSSDGTRLAACINGGYIYISTDSGVNWRQIAYSKSWNCIAASSDLTTLVATIETGLIWTSTITPVDIGTFLMPYTSGAQKTIGLNITTPSFPVILGDTWSAPSVTDVGRPWDSLTASYNGKILIAGSTPFSNNAHLFMSSDSGVTWTQNSITTRFINIYRIFAISCSNDGKIIAVGVMFGTSDSNRSIIISIDSGKNWRQALILAWIFDVDMSYNGQYIVVSSSNNGVRTSVDFGVTWTYRYQNASGHAWFITSSGNGSIVYLYGKNIGILKSTNYGITYSTNISNTGNNIERLATSSSGNIIAYTSSVGIRISTHGGTSWTSKLTNITSWGRISMSNDGSIISAAATGAIYISTDTGVNWSSKSSLSTDTAAAYIVALSGDGSRILASKYNEYLYTSTTSKQVRDIGSIFNNI